MNFWNEELETKPWAEVEQWQAGQIAAMLRDLRRRSLLYAELHAGVTQDLPLRGLADLQVFPFTLKDHVRAAQDAASDEMPFGRNQAMAKSEIVQAIASSGTTGKPLYYALTQRDTEMFTDAIARPR